VLDAAAETTDAVVGVVSKIDVHRGWREVVAANRGMLAAHAPRYARVPWVGVAALPELGEPDVDDLVWAVHDQLADPDLARRNRLRASDSRLREEARRLDMDVDDAGRQARVDALRERRATAMRQRRRETVGRAAALRGQIQQARVQLSFVARNRCAAARSELQEHAAGLSRRDIPGFEGRARARLATVGAEVCEAVDTRLAEVARGICGAFPLPEPPREAPWEPLPEVSVAPPPLTSRRHENWLLTTLGAGFGVGMAVTLSRLVGGLVSRLAPGLALAAAAACVVTGLAVTVVVVHIRGLLHDRALLDRWVGEATASLRSVVEERVATRVLAAETALGGALMARDEAADAQVTALFSAIDGELREYAVDKARAVAARRRQMPAILAALDAVRAELPESQPASRPQTCEKSDTCPGVPLRGAHDNL